MAALFALISEIIWENAKKMHSFNLSESLGNLGIFIVNQLLKPLSLVWKYIVLEWALGFQFFQISVDVLIIVITFFAVEFIYYWQHRLSHEIPLLWALHHTHHSAMKMNLTTAVRLNWVGQFVSPLFFIPLVLVGLSPQIIIICLALGLFYQYFLHTESIKKLGLLEGKVFNTPSAHRVHHGSNEKYVDKNYGAMLIIFDRFFGTYEPENEKVRYGVTSGFFSNNPLKIIFLPLCQYFKGNWKREKHRIKDSTVANQTYSKSIN